MIPQFLLATAVAYEIRTSAFQSRMLAFYSRKLTYTVGQGSSLGRRKSSIRHLAILFFAWNHDRSREVDQALQEWLQVWKSDVTTQEVGRLVRAYGSPRLNISDYGYLL